MAVGETAVIEERTEGYCKNCAIALVVVHKFRITLILAAVTANERRK
jgi:hypothetical protein